MALGFEDFKISKQLHYAIDDLGFKEPTPIQEAAFPVIRSGRDVVGIAQTGTGKTFAYMLPILEDLKFSKQINPRVLILLPTRELVIQVTERIAEFAKYLSIRHTGVYGGVNINRHREAVSQGLDILVGTPGRLNDLILSRNVQLKAIKKLVIDEVDVMLDLGFRYQLTNILDLLPKRRQNILFSATMTEEVDTLIDDFFTAPERITIAESGTPLDTITQRAYAVPNFYTKANLLIELFKDEKTFHKVLVFMGNKKMVERLHAYIKNAVRNLDVIHSNKTQNYRIQAIKYFGEGKTQVLLSTDVMARGIDLQDVSHVISFDVPKYPENYMHRIGRTGRAERKGEALLLYTPEELEAKKRIEALMDQEIKDVELPTEIEISDRLTPDERPEQVEINRPAKTGRAGKGFHEKKEKNKKTNQGGSYRRELAKKYKKPKTRGDKNYNRRNKK